MGKIKRENYINIPGFAVTDLGLKGNDLIIYSIIYGFSQTEGQCFNGSISYLQEWTGASKQGVIKNLNNLVKAGLIIKELGNVTNNYYAAVLPDYVKSEPKSKAPKIVADESTEIIINHFNKVCNTKYLPFNASIKKVIKARLEEGYTVDDLKAVIDYKFDDWGKVPFQMKGGKWSTELLTPGILFGNKFEEYINAYKLKVNTKQVKNVSTSQEVDTDTSDMLF